MRIFIAFAAILMLSIPAYSYQITTITSPQSNEYGYASYPKISRIENMLFNRSFENEDINNRLNRIEQKMFNRINPNIDLSERVDNIIAQIDPGQLYNIPTEKLNQIENKLFGRAYPNDDTETRVIRMEKEMLGAMQGGDLEERYQTVAEAAKHYNAFPTQQEQQQPYYTQPQYNQNGIASTTQSGMKGVFKNILSSMVGGTLTGYTPPIYNNSYAYNNPYYQTTAYPNGYSTSNNWAQNLFPQNNTGFNNYYQTNRGYSNRNTNYGSNSGVHILYD